ncbi:MAG: tetratricopeptide repeat protein [Treponema sp.]|nr:tetratricopeptide repeat protein [Treponema sp.]
MSPKNPLETIYFINLPEDYKFSDAAMQIDASIPLPVQRKTKGDPNDFDMNDIAPEQILAGILTVLAYDSHNEHLDYYRSIINKAKPNIKKELTEAAILKTKNEDWELAEELFMTIRGIDPEDKAVILNLALFLDQRAESHRRAGLTDEADAYDNDALEYYKEAMNAEPAIPDAFFNAGFFYLKQHDFHEAKGAFETYLALTCDAKDEDMDENAKYKQERAQEIVDRISNENMDDAAFAKAYKLISSGKEQEGLDQILSYISSNPKVWNAWFLMGWGLRRLHRYSDAQKAFEQALSCGGDSNSDTYNELAICFMEQDNIAEAKKSLMKALAISPEDTKIISNLGFICLKEGNKPEAQKYFTAVLEYNPNDVIAVSELAKLESSEN